MTVSQHLLHRVAGGSESAAAEDQLVSLHSRSFRGRAWLLAAQICGCFYCLKEFSVDQVKQWVDEEQTALCPYCEIDSVIGFDTPSVHRVLLDAMHSRWFKTVGPTAVQWDEAVASNKWPLPSE